MALIHPSKYIHNLYISIYSYNYHVCSVIHRCAKFGQSDLLCLQCSTQNSHDYETSIVALSWYNEFQFTKMIHHNLKFFTTHHNSTIDTGVVTNHQISIKHAFDSGCSQSKSSCNEYLLVIISDFITNSHYNALPLHLILNKSNVCTYIIYLKCCVKKLLNVPELQQTVHKLDCT